MKIQNRIARIMRDREVHPAIDAIRSVCAAEGFSPSSAAIASELRRVAANTSRNGEVIYEKSQP